MPLPLVRPCDRHSWNNTSGHLNCGRNLWKASTFFTPTHHAITRRGGGEVRSFAFSPPHCTSLWRHPLEGSTVRFFAVGSVIASWESWTALCSSRREAHYFNIWRLLWSKYKILCLVLPVVTPYFRLKSAECGGFCGVLLASPFISASDCQLFVVVPFACVSEVMLCTF